MYNGNINLFVFTFYTIRYLIYSENEYIFQETQNSVILLKSPLFVYLL